MTSRESTHVGNGERRSLRGKGVNKTVILETEHALEMKLFSATEIPQL